MPLSPPITTPIFLSDLAANALIGISTPQFALAVATGLQIYAGSGLQVVSVDVGTLGAGVGLGLGVTISPSILIASFTASFAANGLLGIMSPPMINALALGFATVMQQGIVTTVSAGVGLGAGVATLVPNPGASAAAWVAGFAAAGLVGPNIPQMANAIAQGFDTAAPSAIGAVVIAGPPNILPGAGVGTGVIA